MNKIWFFGDSYVANHSPLWLKEKHGAKSWTQMLTEAFPEYTNENIAIAGSSLDFLYYTYEQRRKEFKSGDIVIMSLTNIERLFLRQYKKSSYTFLRFPGITVYEDGEFLKATVNYPAQMTEDHPWYTYFADDLFNPETHKATLNLFLNSLQYDAMTKGIKIIALPITHFPFLDTEDKDHITLGKTKKGMDLCAVSKTQMETKFNEKCQNNYFANPKFYAYDTTLANHLTLRNNEILANKVIRNIKTNEPIDLGTEWEY